MKNRTFILTAVAFASAHGALRGNGNLLVPQRLAAFQQHPERMLPQKKDSSRLKRMNDERKRKNKQARQKRDQKQDSDIMRDDQWKNLSKEGKKELLKHLRDEERKDEDDRSQNKDSDQGEEDNSSGAIRAQVKHNQLAYLHQYFSHLDDGMELNSQVTEIDADITWSDLTKEEKKRIKEMMNGELQIKNEMVDDSDEDRTGWKELTKQEKKELLGKSKENDEEEVITPTSNQASSLEDGTDEDQASNSNESSNEAQDFVIHNRPKPGTLTVEEIMDFHSQNGGNDQDEKEDDMAENSEQSSSNTKYEEEDFSSDANEFILPMPSLTFNNDQGRDQDENHVEDEDTSPNSAANSAFASSDQMPSSVEVTSAVPSCPDCFTFAEELTDQSFQLDSFDTSSDLDWSMSGLGWNLISQGCFESSSCIASGIKGSPDHQGKQVYSNLTLTLNEDFNGGVLIFQLMAKDESNLPNEAFYVTVDDVLELSIMSTESKWTEYSVSVDKGRHTVTWSHVYNPLGLEAVPAINAGRIIMDDLRYHPFERVGRNQGFEDKSKGLIMTSDGDATWKVDDKDSGSGKYSILASSDSIKANSGSSNVNFLLYTREGGTLKFKMSTSTTAPHDDFSILLNGKPVDAFFGSMPTFEDQSLEIPMGKTVVTLQHRKNPGKLSRNILDSLGKVRTKSYTRLDDIGFEPKT